MRGPTFFIIGAAKAGTTSLSSLLAVHPQAGMVREKEPHYFSCDERSYASGWDKYLSLYSHCQNAKVLGDASTSNSRIRYCRDVIDRISNRAPDAKIIYMVRHPLERMEAAYVEHLCSRDSPPLISINEAIAKLPMIVDSSRYWEVYEAYKAKFGESNIAIVWFEEYTANIAANYRRICVFLGIDDSIPPDLSREQRNARAGSAFRMAALGRNWLKIDTQWNSATRKRVVDQIRDDNVRFLHYFGRPKDYWGPLF